MPKINVYLPDELAAAVRDAQIPVSAICQSALERAVRDVGAARGSDIPPDEGRPDAGLFGRFTPRARQALITAEAEARRFPHGTVGTEHVLLGMLEDRGNLGVRVLHSLDIEIDDLCAELLASMPPASPAPDSHIPFSAASKQALEATAKEALALGHNYIGCEHLLLGLLATEDGLASKVLRRMGVELRTTRRAVTTALTDLLTQPVPPGAATPAPAGTRSEAADAATLQQIGAELVPSLLTDIVRRLDALERRLPE